MYLYSLYLYSLYLYRLYGSGKGSMPYITPSSSQYLRTIIL